MGSNDHYPEEAPAHQVTVNGFWIDQYTVTNAQFSRFVEETDYVTSAERAPNPTDYPGAKAELLVPASESPQCRLGGLLGVTQPVPWTQAGAGGDDLRRPQVTQLLAQLGWAGDDQRLDLMGGLACGL